MPPLPKCHFKFLKVLISSACSTNLDRLKGSLHGFHRWSQAPTTEIVRSAYERRQINEKTTAKYGNLLLYPFATVIGEGGRHLPSSMETKSSCLSSMPNDSSKSNHFFRIGSVYTSWSLHLSNDFAHWHLPRPSTTAGH